MRAHDRSVHDWFSKIRAGEITLPRFQRFEAWEHSRVAGLLNTVFQTLPSGACLVLEVGEKEPFPSRPLKGAPATGPRVTEQLLDGQQRLTALWRSLHDDYEKRPYFIQVPVNDGKPELDIKQVEAISITRYLNKKQNLMPAYLNDPVEVWKRGLIPLTLLRPEDIADEIRKWVNAAIPPSPDTYQDNQSLGDFINKLRTTVREYNLPYLNLASSTPPDVALDVFVKMNTSSVKLTLFDIVVALVEEAVGKSLHELTEQLSAPDIRADRYFDLSAIALDVSALLQDKLPNQRGYNSLDYDLLTQNWEKLKKGIRWAVEFLEEQKIYDAERLPSYPPIPVLAALHERFPSQPDLMGRVRSVLRKYLWRAFLTDRYDSSSSSRILVDFRELRAWLGTDMKSDPKAPVFRDSDHPLASVEQILRAPWPKRSTTLGRALLALQNRCGAYDIADDAPISAGNVTGREYHHSFPDKILKDAGLEDESFLAVNCMLITGKTNRNISAKEPVKYLKERVERVDLQEAALQKRLRSHLMPWAELNVGGYDGLPDDPDAKAKVSKDYRSFMTARARLLKCAVDLAANGETPDTDQVFAACNDAADSEQYEDQP